jgi:hypothetical protein
LLRAAALDATEYAATWRTLSKELGTTDWTTLRAAMFGSPQAGLPMWAGYRAPKLDLRAMTAAPASEFMPRATGK